MILHVKTLHEFCIQVAKKYNSKFTQDKTFFDDPTQIFDTSPEQIEVFSALIIDEGQDFKKKWLEDIEPKPSKLVLKVCKP